jgi:transposase
MQILLAADAGVSDMAIEASVKTSGSTVYRTKKRFVEISLEAALSEKPRPGAARKLSGRQEAQLVALACSDTPKGCARWTLKLLANAFFEHQSVSRETIRRPLDDNDLKPWQKKMWCIAKIDGEYIAPMEDLLDLYAEPHDPKRPVERDTRTSRTIGIRDRASLLFDAHRQRKRIASHLVLDAALVDEADANEVGDIATAGFFQLSCRVPVCLSGSSQTFCHLLDRRFLLDIDLAIHTSELVFNPVIDVHDGLDLPATALSERFTDNADQALRLQLENKWYGNLSI